MWALHAVISACICSHVYVYIFMHCCQTCGYYLFIISTTRKGDQLDKVYFHGLPSFFAFMLFYLNVCTDEEKINLFVFVWFSQSPNDTQCFVQSWKIGNICHREYFDPFDYLDLWPMVDKYQSGLTPIWELKNNIVHDLIGRVHYFWMTFDPTVIMNFNLRSWNIYQVLWMPKIN